MRLEIWSDMVCPWCYIGKRRVAAALSRFERRDQVEVEWRSFELDANAQPSYPGTLQELLAKKYGVSLERAHEMNARVTSLAAQEGLEFQLDRARHVNTFNAHRLGHFAGTKGLRAEMTERLFKAYFMEGFDIGDNGTLIRLAGEVGLDADEVGAALRGDAFAKAVRAEENRALEFGIQGVPYVAIDERFGVSGAQSAEVFLGALQKAWTQAQES